MAALDERFATMSLGSKGPCTIENAQRRGGAVKTGDTLFINRTDDIDGARPELKYLRYCEKRPDLYITGDIKGAAPGRLHRDTNKIDHTLMLDDIEGAKPKPYTFKTSREVNPLNPEYPLASTELVKHAPPKFVRDAYSIGDIQGTAPRPRFRFAQRENHEVHDIEGAQAGWRPRHERARREGAARDGLDVHDINDLGFKTRRVTDPLRPAHFVNGMAISDDMVSTMPKSLPKKRDGPTYSLTTQDIEGAQCGWKPPHEMQPPIEIRRHFRNTNFVGDIAGAQPDTVKHAIRTNRVSNPLNPVYKSLDGEVLAAPTTPMYGEPAGDGDLSTMLMTAPAEAAYVSTIDPKDDMIAQLEQEVERLRTTAPLATGERTASGVPQTGMPQTSDIAPTKTAKPNDFVAPQASSYLLKPTTGPTRSAADGERLVLRSSSGEPRVAMTPSERRQAKAITEDIAAVRDL